MGIIMDDFYYEESNPKHVFIKCLIIALVIAICLGAFLFYKEKNTIKLKKVVIELGDKLSENVTDYLENGDKFSNEYKLYLDEVNINKAGTYKYKVRYNKHVEESEIIIKDTTKPEVTVGDITVGIDESINPMYLVTSCNDLSLPCSAVFKEESILEKIKKPGTYNTEIKVSDAVGNSVLMKVNITSTKTASFSSIMTNDLEY